MASTPTDVAPKQRALASGVVVTLGLASIVVDLIPSGVPNRDKATSFHSLCHECDEPVRLRQQLGCPNGHGPFTLQDVVRKGQELPDGTVVDVTAEEIAAIRDTEDGDGPKALNLAVVRANEVLDQTLPGGGTYRFRPNAKTTAKGSYSLLVTLVRQALKSGRVLVGDISVRGGAPKMVWLNVRHDQVIASELMRPSDIAAFDVISDIDVSEKVRDLSKELIEKMTQPFVPEEWANGVRARAEALLEQKAADPGATITPITKAAKSEVDLEALLSQMVS